LATGELTPEAIRDAGDTTAERLLPRLLLAFAPLHKRAFGIATGTATAVLMAFLTLMRLIDPTGQQFPLHLLGQYFAGYTVSWWGVLTGALWGFGVGFVAGWFVAFCRNLALAVSFFAIRTRAEMAQTRDFLDHI
jgi:hypothetical protein